MKKNSISKKKAKLTKKLLKLCYNTELPPPMVLEVLAAELLQGHIIMMDDDVVGGWRATMQDISKASAVHGLTMSLTQTEETVH